MESARDELLEEDACDTEREAGRVSDGSDIDIGAEVGGIGRGDPLREVIDGFFEGKRV